MLTGSWGQLGLGWPLMVCCDDLVGLCVHLGTYLYCDGSYLSVDLRGLLCRPWWSGVWTLVVWWMGLGGLVYGPWWSGIRTSVV